MWLPQQLLVAIVAVQLHTNVAQLGNSTFCAEDILDVYDPLLISGNTTRIVGGKIINISRIPWQIALYDSGYFVCGGSIISRNWVLTAAHCVETGNDFKVNAGSPNYRKGGQIRVAEVVVPKRSYNSNTLNSDIALIRVRSPFKWTSMVRPVTLARPKRKLPSRYLASGWGTLTEDGLSPIRLRGVTVQNVKWSDCKRMYNAADVVITKTMICAASPGKDACQGDSGGPLVHENIQYGVVSFGVGCAYATFPGVYTNVRGEYAWIRGVIRRIGGQQPTFA